jgi:hypothetical protein
MGYIDYGNHKLVISCRHYQVHGLLVNCLKICFPVLIHHGARDFRSVPSCSFSSSVCSVQLVYIISYLVFEISEPEEQLESAEIH